ncbi:hypothetical protein SAMN05444401_1562 [Clostridium amylolyticum]|uniref:DUF7922 domain-containing protein n=1 Tax=Clostridium amylolyticum TaxID=1121298 RepID=A0A1M6EFU9_9CLOT|nr:hypothetical protein [Clostridium amylolyticum]SHI84352.1 hypothetical protein SAMN05444401_1562 [Clostridium amylolyticum]
MAHSKLYRNFLILKEDGKGYSVSSDKPLSGYAKIEGKGDKCKITFYAQNIKKDSYHMILMCFKKGMKQNINLGAMNINEQGRAEISNEYSMNNIANTGAQLDNISGAAIVKVMGSSFTVIMCGFMSGEKAPEDWSKINITNIQPQENMPKEIKREEDTPKEIKPEENIPKEDIRVESMAKKDTTEDIIPPSTQASKLNDIPEKEKSVERIEEKTRVIENTNVDNSEVLSIPKEYMPGENNTYANIIPREELEKIDERFTQREDNSKNEENEFDKYEKIIEASKIVLEESKSAQNIKSKNKENNNIKLDDKNRDNEEEDFILRGSVADFFEAAAEGFEPMRGICKEVKYCKWYKVKVDNLDTLCNISNYNKYTIAYYPMMNYYPYIKKYGHYLLGYKCDPSGKMKYLVYGIPGKKDKADQPYGGKSGFVTWVPSEDKDKDMGFWLMFFDFKNSVIVVPMK